MYWCGRFGARGRTASRAQRWFFPALALTFALVPALHVPAAAPARSDWNVRSWQTKAGLPQNNVNAIVQTRDGFLWVATSGGLARFDGVRFRNFGLQDGLRSVRIHTLLEDPRGTLWVGTVGGGVSRWENGRLTPLGDGNEFPGLNVQSLAGETDGTLWIGTELGLLRWRQGVFSRIGPAEGLPARQIRAMQVDSRGVLWVSVLSDGLYQGTNGHFVRLPVPVSDFGTVYSLLEDRDGAMWVGAGNAHLWRWREGVWQRFGATNGLPRNELRNLAQGPAETLWVGAQNSGIYFHINGGFQRLAGPAGFPEDPVSALCVDREGTLWVGTVGGGLSRLSRRLIDFWGKAEGLPEPGINSVAVDAAGSYWVATQNGGTWRFADGRFTRPGEPATAATSAHVYAALAAGDGSVWTAGEQFLLRFRPGQTSQAYVAPPIAGEAIRALCADGPNLWLGTYYSTLLKFDGTNAHVAATNGTFAGNIASLVCEGPDILWVGSASGVYRWDHGRIQKWGTREGLLTANVRALHRDADGTIWIGTHGGGLSRLKQGRIATITSRLGLADDIISQIVPDDLGHLWLGSDHGLMRLDRRELEACADGAVAVVHPTVFDADDGLLSDQCIGGHSPTALKTAEGRLLFPTIRGLIDVDPRRLEPEAAPPPRASVEEVLLDGRPQSVAAPLVIPPGQHRLEIYYTAPSLRGADWVRFRHRLDPLDQDWVQDGARRRVVFGSLAPGRYVFQVAASDLAGHWNQSGANLDVEVQPEFWRTGWFLAVAAVAVAAAGVAVYRRRTSHNERHRTAQEALTRQIIVSQENERKRVASELHDGLSQDLALLAVELDMFRQRLPESPAQLAGRLEELARQTQGLAAEVHRISHGLHPAKLNQLGLGVALNGFCREVETAHALPVRCEARDVPRTLPEDVALCLYRVTQEALQNVVKHSGAHAVRVHLAVAGGALELTIADDGRGFDASALHLNGSLGLVNMHERVRLVHGEIRVDSRPGEGTRVHVRVPLPQAPAA